MDANARRHFRIKFPPKDRPKVVFAGFDFDVIDISESGVKFKGVSKGMFAPRQSLEGQILFNSQAPIAFTAKVVRIIGDLIVLTFTRNIPRECLRLEADRLLNLYQKLE